MADLNELQSAGSTKISGANPITGDEGYYANVDPNGGLSIAGEGVAGAALGGVLTIQGALNGSQVPTRDLINTSGQNAAISVTAIATEALGGGTILANRKFISIIPTNGTIYWGFTSGVTILSGSPIFSNQTLVLSFTHNVHVYVVSAGTVNCRIAEGS